MCRAERVTRTGDGVESSRVEETFACRALTADSCPRRWSLRVNGRPMFLRGACYAPAYRLDELNAVTLAADIAAAKTTDVEPLVVVADVPTGVFHLLDDEGVMVLLDLPPMSTNYVYDPGG